VADDLFEHPRLVAIYSDRRTSMYMPPSRTNPGHAAGWTFDAEPVRDHNDWEHRPGDRPPGGLGRHSARRFQAPKTSRCGTDSTIR